MKRSSIIKAIALAAVLTASLPLSAQAFTGLFGSNSEVDLTGDTNEFSFAQSNWISAGMKIPLSSNSASYFATQATGTFEFDYGTGGPSTTVLLDLDLLKLNTVFKNKNNETLTIAAGRFPFSDATGLIFAQPADGAIVQIRTQDYSASVSASYTGFLNGNTVAMLASDGATADKGTDLTVYAFASPYLIASLSYSMPYIFANQTSGIELLSVVDMPGVGIATGDDPSMWRAYATLFLNGPVASFIYYDFTSTFEVKSGSWTVANLSTANVSIYPGFLGSAFNISATYASGENGAFVPFTGFTRITAASAAQSPLYSGIIKFGGQASIKPTDKIYVALNGYGLLDAQTSIGYYGTQAGLTAIYQIFTDLQVKFNAGTFIGADPANNKTSISLNAVISF